MDSFPRWLRVTVVVTAVALATGLSIVGYRYITRPLTLTVAAGSFDGDAPRLMTALANRLAANKSHIRLNVVTKGTALDASRAFAAGEANMAVIRGDMAEMLTAARTVVLISHGVVLLIVPPGVPVESIDALRGKTVAVLSGEANRRVVDTLKSVGGPTVRFRDITPDEVGPAIKAKQVSAILVVIPLTDRYLAMVRNLFQLGPKQTVRLLPIESAEAIANIEKYYESYDVPKGTLRGAPPVPDDDLTTLRIPFYLVANRSLSNDVVTDLTKAIMDARRDLASEFPILSQIGAPSTDKDAYIPIHPGAKIYFDGDEKTFFDKYGDQFFYGSMVLGSITSILAALWKFMGFGSSNPGHTPLDPLYNLAARIRSAQSNEELEAVEEEIDNVIRTELDKYAKGDSRAVDSGVLSLATHRLEHLIDLRRRVLGVS